jgi:CBS domain-containing protein
MTSTLTVARRLRACDVMSAPVHTVTPATSPWVAWNAMVEHGVRHLVVTSGSRCVGVLDDRTVFAQWPMGPLALRRARIGTMVTMRTTCVLPETPLADVARVMIDDVVDAVPVVDEHGSLVGLVTAGDVVAAVARCGVVDEVIG